MKFEYFEIKNFKGIEHLRINLNKPSNFNVHTLVGLNESGKTTILEAINYFKHKPESLDFLDLKGYKIDDIHDIIPISKRDNFNGFVEIQGSVILDESDETAIRVELYNKSGITLTRPINRISFMQKYYFENSRSIPQKDKFLWIHNFYGKTKSGKISKNLTNEQIDPVLSLIRNSIPSILFFPNFLFDFPSKIYLEDLVSDKKHAFYKSVIQDVLDSLNNNLDVETHIVERAKSTDKNDDRHLKSVLDKMAAKVTTEVFNAWKEIFDNRISKKEIVITHDKDENGVYLEFLLKDSDGKYLINERSLGFRWFFVFLLLTQFRGYRKQNKNSLFLLDEPASNLHSSAQAQLLNSFGKLSEVIYTTHSHHLINPIWLENTYIVKNEGLDYLSKSDEYNSSMTKVTATPYREFANQHPDQRNYFQPILDVLDYAPSNIEFINKCIFVEGKNDYYSYNYAQKNLKVPEKRKLSFMPGTSAGNLDSLISLYLGWGKSFVILLDSDAEGLKQKKRYLDNFGLSLESVIFTYADISDEWSNLALEAMYDDLDKVNIYNLMDVKEKDRNKKNFHRSVQELLVKNQTITFTKNTTENFKRVFKFLSEKL